MATITISSPRDLYLEGLTTPTSLSPDDSTCFVCFGDLRSLNAAYAHDDMHLICVGCLEKWTEVSNTCPHCRQTLFEKEDDRVDEAVELASTATSTNEIDGAFGFFLRDAHRLYVNATDFESEREAQEYVLEVLADRGEVLADRTDNNPEVRYSTTLELEARNWAAPEVYEQINHRIDAENIRRELFHSWFIGHFCNGSNDVFHHPVASKLLLETLSAIKQWEGTMKTPEMLRFCLAIRYRHFERELDVPAELSEAFAVYREWMLDEVKYILSRQRVVREKEEAEAMDESL